MRLALSIFWRVGLSILLCGTLALFTSDVLAGGKVGVYGIRMAPSGSDARTFSRAGWGGGIRVVVPISQLDDIFAGTIGFEIVNLLDQTVVFRDDLTGLRIEQQTMQNYYRIYLGAEVGPHGHGFVRPHAGINIAIAPYDIDTDVVIPDDSDRENEIRQNLRHETHSVFGYDITLGLDLNIANKVSLDGGVRFLKSFSVPQQLGDQSLEVFPEYFQVYLGMGLSFGLLAEEIADDSDDETVD